MRYVFSLGEGVLNSQHKQPVADGLFRRQHDIKTCFVALIYRRGSKCALGLTAILSRQSLMLNRTTER
jgi:hypothetical protein